MRASIAVRVLLLGVAASCARRVTPPTPKDPAAREAILLTAHDLAPGRGHCRMVDPEAALPNVGTVLDTAAMPDYLRQAGVASDTGYALFSLRFDATGKPVRARLIEATLPDSLDRAVQQAVASALIERPAGAPLAMRLRLDLAPALRYRLGKSEYCDPEEIAGSPGIQPQGSGPRPSPATARTVTTIKYDVELSSTGQVLDVHAASPLTDAMRGAILASRWKPAIDDGVPVAARASSTARTTSWVEARSAP